MKLINYLLRILPPEIAHSIALHSLNVLYKLRLVNLFFPVQQSNSDFRYKDLIFKNRLGIAAGLDKNGDYIDALGALGFGFLEVGTITPLPQPGNVKPRIFRFANQKAIINRLGFNNKGVDYLVEKIKFRKFKGIVGVNIGANKDSEGQKRIDDYVECFEKVSPYSDYITINISSPNTPNLRVLHAKENFLPLFDAFHQAQQKTKYVNPIFIKLSPDEDSEAIAQIVDAIKKFNFDGLIASNTTLDRKNLKDNSNQDHSGGLSGKPLFNKSNELLRVTHKQDQNLIKIGVGGVFNKEDFHKKLELGASLVQIYTSFIYEGPRIIRELLK